MADGPALQDHKISRSVYPLGGVAPYSTKEGTATCGKTLGVYPRQTWRLGYCRLLTHQDNNPRISVARPQAVLQIFTASRPAASAPRAAPIRPHLDKSAVSWHAARAACSSAASREPPRESSNRLCSRANASPALPSIRRDIRYANNTPSARPCSPSCAPYRH